MWLKTELFRIQMFYWHLKCVFTAVLSSVVLPVQVSLLLPECSSAPSHLDTVFSSFNSFYLIRNMPIYELLDKHFLKTAVYQGNTPVHTWHTPKTHLWDDCGSGGRASVLLWEGRCFNSPCLHVEVSLGHVNQTTNCSWCAGVAWQPPPSSVMWFTVSAFG